jgi:hypothetical protein
VTDLTPRAVPPEPVSGGPSGSAPKVGSQRVRIRVDKVLRGPGGILAPAELEVEKPEAKYSLRPGNRGPFLLEDTPRGAVILGRYGPDTWRLETVERALDAPLWH